MLDPYTLTPSQQWADLLKHRLEHNSSLLKTSHAFHFMRFYNNLATCYLSIYRPSFHCSCPSPNTRASLLFIGYGGHVPAYGSLCKGYCYYLENSSPKYPLGSLNSFEYIMFLMRPTLTAIFKIQTPTSTLELANLPYLAMLIYGHHFLICNL